MWCIGNGVFKYFVNHTKEMCSVIQFIISAWTTLSNVKRKMFEFWIQIMKNIIYVFIHYSWGESTFLLYRWNNNKHDKRKGVL